MSRVIKAFALAIPWAFFVTALAAAPSVGKLVSVQIVGLLQAGQGYTIRRQVTVKEFACFLRTLGAELSQKYGRISIDRTVNGKTTRLVVEIGKLLEEGKGPTIIEFLDGDVILVPEL